MRSTPDRVDARQVGLVEPDGHVEALGGFPEPVEVGMVDGAATDLVGPDDAAHEAVPVDRPFGLGGGEAGVLLRQ